MRSHTDTSPLSRSPLNTTYRENNMNVLHTKKLANKSASYLRGIEVAELDLSKVSNKNSVEARLIQNKIKAYIIQHRLVVVQLQEAIWSL